MAKKPARNTTLNSNEDVRAKASLIAETKAQTSVRIAAYAAADPSISPVTQLDGTVVLRASDAVENLY